MDWKSLEFPLREPAKLLTPSETDCAYAAGILDGEGTFSIASARDKRDNIKRQYLAFQIGTTDLTVLLWMQQRFGGTIYFHYRSKAARAAKKHRQAFVLQWGPKYVVALSKTAGRFLKLKKEQMEILVSWVKQTWSGLYGEASHSFLTDKKKQIREDLRDRLMELNKKGPRAGSRAARAGGRR